MVEPLPERFAERHHPRRHAVDEHVHVDRDPRLELGQPEQGFHQRLGLDRAGARLKHDPHVVGRLVAHVGEQRQLALVEQVRDLFDQPRLLDPVGNLADDRDPAAAAGILLRPARAQTEGAATGAVGVDDRGLGVDDDAAGREVRTRHELGHRFGVGARVGDEVERRVAEFGDVVRRDRGRHADRDALRAVGEQVRNRGRHDDRLLGVAGVVVAPVDRIFLDALHEETGDVGHPRLGVAVGGGVVAVDVAEIALPLDQRVARGEILREAHQGLVDRLVAMRMERPHDVADDLGAFLEG